MATSGSSGSARDAGLSSPPGRDGSRSTAKVATKVRGSRSSAGAMGAPSSTRQLPPLRVPTAHTDQGGQPQTSAEHLDPRLAPSPSRGISDQGADKRHCRWAVLPDDRHHPPKVGSLAADTDCSTAPQIRVRPASLWLLLLFVGSARSQSHWKEGREANRTTVSNRLCSGGKRIGGNAVLLNVRAGTHAGYDRVSFDFCDLEPETIEARQVLAYEIWEDGSGAPVTVQAATAVGRRRPVGDVVPVRAGLHPAGLAAGRGRARDDAAP